jgi:hypothetical protein
MPTSKKAAKAPTLETPVKVILPEGIPQIGVTNEYLRQHKNTLPVTIPVYAEQTPGDTIGLCIGGPDEKPLIVVTVTHADKETVIPVPAALLHLFADAVHLIYYKICTPNSKGEFLRLHLNPRMP